MRLSPNFELAEFVTSREGGCARDRQHPAAGLAGQPPQAWRSRSSRSAPSRARGAPIVITSGYRCSRLNARSEVPRAPTHAGLAADFIAPHFGTPADVCHAIVRHGIAFDQLIHEYDWVHFGLGPRMRHQILTYQGNGKYLPGILEKA
jgi:zinc D-Ala-D-Ala carboxypeptidase